MPPKTKTGNNSKKNEQKKQQKIVEDKTFGLKNKNKSKSVQKYIKGVQSQVQGVQSKKQIEAIYREKKQKELEKEREALEKSLIKPVAVQPKVPIGVDPKSVVCEFFKKGLCSKGDKCKYSHNLDQSRKSEKIDLYVDRRDIKELQDNLDNNNVENWNEDKLEEIINKKHGKESNKSMMICKYFLEAVEQKKYGWFWECPNGGDKCQYRHCLPPGFVLKEKKEEKKEEEIIPLEEILEKEREKLTTRTPLTLELFLKWKEEKKKKKEENEKNLKEKREADIKLGKVLRSGREMFVYNPDLFVDEENVFDTSLLPPEELNEGPIINLDITGTSIKAIITNNNEQNGKEENLNKIEVQENLFIEEDIPDLNIHLTE